MRVEEAKQKPRCKNQCKHCGKNANVKILGITKAPILLCNFCFEELKTLRLPKEPVYEWQWLFVYPEDGHTRYKLTQDYYTEEETNGAVFDGFSYQKFEPSKRVREE